MKRTGIRVFIIIISTILLLSCIACSTENTNSKPAASTPRSNTPKPSPKQVSESEMISLAKDFVWGHRNMFKVSGIKNISNMEIASATVINKSAQIVNVKGNFYGLDEYGTIIGKYVFDWDIEIVTSSKGMSRATYNAGPSITKKY